MDEVLYFFKGILYWIRCRIFPYNVVKIKHLSQGWHDRDAIMFHACFQILVDYVEREQPFKSFDKRFRGRHTNVREMREYIDSMITPEGMASFYADWYNEEDKERSDSTLLRKHEIDSEVLRLYEWYKNREYEFNFEKYRKLTGKTTELVTGKGKLEFRSTETGEPMYITLDELKELRQEHEDSVRGKLQRLINIRETLWT